MRSRALLALLGGDHPELALAELKAVLETSGTNPGEPQVHGRIVTIQVDKYPQAQFIKRLGLTRLVCQLWDRFDLNLHPPPSPNQLAQLVSSSGQLPQGSFRVRATRTGDAPGALPVTRYEREVGAELLRPNHPANLMDPASPVDLVDTASPVNPIEPMEPTDPVNTVDLFFPDHTLRLLAGQQLFWGLELGATAYKETEGHHVRHRPHFAPVSLHPRLARAMVNLARLPAGGMVVDPFCGTGGILLEGGLMGYRCFGSDLLEEMVNGSATNLAHFGVPDDRIELSCGEVGDLPDAVRNSRPPTGPMAIVTDPPYGRSTTTDREPIESLMERAFAAFAEILGPGERVVLALPSARLWEPALEIKEFILECQFQQRVHGSLTRHFGVLVRTVGTGFAKVN